MRLRTTQGRLFLVAFAITITVNGLILFYFHNRFWWPPDEGAYVHTAERILKGEALNSQVEEIHTGYLNFVHAAAFALFGVKLVSLRYPLVAIAFIQSLLVFLLFARHNLLAGVVASIGAICLGVPQYLNPQPSWYCLFAVTLIAYCLTYIPKDRKYRLELIGLLVGLVFLLRQVTGVFVAMGLLTYLLTEHPHEAKGQSRILARGLIALMALGTFFYLRSATDSFGFLLVGIWPLVFLGQAFLIANISNRKSLEIVTRLGAGAVIASLPILFYHIWHNSLWTFADDTVLRALAVSKFNYLQQATYLTFQSYGLQNVFERADWVKVINGLYWFALPFTPIVAGVATVIRFRNVRSASKLGATPILAVFYSMVALLQQIPIYLYYTLPLVFAALFWLSLNRRTRLVALTVITIVISAISLYWHAGQPVTRRIGGIVRGERIALEPATSLERAGLWIDSESLMVYSELVSRIKDSSLPDETIFVVPNNPELYFLADRKNPFRFWNSAIGIRDEREKEQVFSLIKREPPKLVIFAPNDRNNTKFSEELMTHVKLNYRLDRKIAGFEIYVSQ